MIPPKISVVLPTIFRKDLIQSTLESILPQMRPDDELLISLNVDDAAVAGCRDAIAKFIQTISAISPKFVHPGRRIKIFEHWNFAIGSASNECIVFVHDDEIYNCNLLEIARTEFGNASDITLITGGQVNVFASKKGINVHPEIVFDERRVSNGHEWIQQQANSMFPKYGATAYVFRRQNAEYWFLAGNVRVSDALLMYHQACRGKVVERPEVFGTHLEHSSNTTLIDLLEVGHTPYWKGFLTMGKNENFPLLVQTGLAMKQQAHLGYSRCAIASALPIHDKAGYKECFRQCALAETQPTSLLRFIDTLPGKWIYMPLIVRLAKKLIRKRRARTRDFSSTADQSLAKILQCDESTIKNFKTRAISHAR